MNNSTEKFPVYAKLSIVTIGFVSLFFILYIGQDIIIPLVFATLIAILLNPVVNFLSAKGINRIVAIVLSLAAGIIILAALVYFISSQVTTFMDSFPAFKEKFSILINDIINWLSHALNINKNKINAWIAKTKGEGMAPNAVIGKTLGTLGGILVFSFLLPVYIFMVLFYKPLLLEFIARLFKKDKHGVVAEVLAETKTLIQSYLVGLLLEAAIVATLNSIGLMIIGLDYAILLGIIGALLNVIPYIGGLIAIALPMILAIASKQPIDVLWVLIAYLAVQFIDNNFIVPRIVASKVKVNALVSIVVVFIGGAMWGISGMFLSIPLTAIIKVIFDRIEPLTPFGFLLGDNQPDIRKVIFKIKPPKSKSS